MKAHKMDDVKRNTSSLTKERVPYFEENEAVEVLQQRTGASGKDRSDLSTSLGLRHFIRKNCVVQKMDI